MESEILLLLDAKISAASLQNAWSEHPKASDLGHLEQRPAFSDFTGAVELVILPALAAITANVLTDLIRDLLPKPKRESANITIHVLPDGREAITVEAEGEGSSSNTSNRSPESSEIKKPTKGYNMSTLKARRRA